MKRLVILAAALATAAPVAGNAADYAWPVLRVIDGDTLAVDASADMPPELAEVRRRSAARSAAAVTAPVPSARVRGTRDGGMGREALMVVHGLFTCRACQALSRHVSCGGLPARGAVAANVGSIRPSGSRHLGRFLPHEPGAEAPAPDDDICAEPVAYRRASSPSRLSPSKLRTWGCSDRAYPLYAYTH